MSARKGGKRPGAGRPAGALNKITKTLREKAAEHADDVLAVLVEVATDPSQPAAARVNAASAVLDRAFGRPSVSLEVEQKSAATPDTAALIALSEAMDRSREERRAIMARREQMGFTGD